MLKSSLQCWCGRHRELVDRYEKSISQMTMFFFPFVVDVLFVYHRQDLYRTWLWDECIISETGAAYSSRTHGFNPPVFWSVLLIFSVFRVFLLCFCCFSSFCFVCPILLVSLDYSFLIASSVFSNDYFFSHFSFWFTSTRINKTIRSFII